MSSRRRAATTPSGTRRIWGWSWLGAVEDPGEIWSTTGADSTLTAADVGDSTHRRPTRENYLNMNSRPRSESGERTAPLSGRTLCVLRMSSRRRAATTLSGTRRIWGWSWLRAVGNPAREAGFRASHRPRIMCCVYSGYSKRYEYPDHVRNASMRKLATQRHRWRLACLTLRS